MKTVGRVSVTHSLIPWRKPSWFFETGLYYMVGGLVPW